MRKAINIDKQPVLWMFLLSFTTDWTDWTDGCGGIRQKHNKPLGEDGGLCPAVMLPLWSYKSELLTPKTESITAPYFIRSPSSPRR